MFSFSTKLNFSAISINLWTTTEWDFIFSSSLSVFVLTTKKNEAKNERRRAWNWTGVWNELRVLTINFDSMAAQQDGILLYCVYVWENKEIEKCVDKGGGGISMVFVVKLYCNLQFEAKRFKSSCCCCCLSNKRTHKKCKKKTKHFTNKSHLKLHFHNSILGGNPSARKIIILLRKDLSFLHPNELSLSREEIVLSIIKWILSSI